MKFIELDEKEFKKFADSSEQISFYQTSSWANLKRNTGWNKIYVGLKDNNKIVAAALILSKTLPIIKRKVFYSPRGFLIDYNNYSLLEQFTRELKRFAKDKRAIFVKIDPYVEYQKRDNNGQVVDESKKNDEAINNLKKLGYKHFGFNIMQESLQPRWMHVIETKDRTLDDVDKDMESKTRQIIRKNEKSAIHCREIERSELKIFKDIMQKTGDRQEFVDRPLTYYENMWDSLHDDGILKILIAEIDFNEYEDNTKKELEEIKKELDDRTYKFENKIIKMNEKKYEQSNKNDRDSINRLQKQLAKIKEYKKEYGEKTILGGILFLVYQNEVLSLYGGSYENLMQFQSAYTLHYEGVKMAVEGNYKRYNFYGITGDFSDMNPLYGLYLFKKSFGGHVVELIGEFDLVISKFWFFAYKVFFALYHKAKNIRVKNKI